MNDKLLSQVNIQGFQARSCLVTGVSFSVSDSTMTT